MPISIDELRRKSAEVDHYSMSTLRKSASALVENRSTTTRVQAFLCHAHADQDLVVGLQRILAEHGLDLYIDWQDSAMPASPNRETANRIKEKIRRLPKFLFLATENSTRSRWCPWEIGFADGVKPLESILIIPTKDRSGNHYGNEYLQLYRYLDYAGNYDLRSFGPKS